jgi:dipeptidyl aminopeptidase/acylaminoacyl peptidase
VTTDASQNDRATSPFADLDAYVALPRTPGLWLSPDGRRLVVGVTTPDKKKNRYTTALWEVDPEGARPARRLTRSAQGESGAAFTPAGDLLFVSARPEPGDEEDRDTTSLWLQPAGGGDARTVASPPGGVRSVTVAAKAGTVVFGSAMLPSSADLAADEDLRAKRKDSGISAILHEEYPIRFWDHDLGPGRTRLLRAEEVTGGEGRAQLRDLTGHVGRALDDRSTWDISADGLTVVAGWVVAEPGGSERRTVVAIDMATGERRVLADDPDHDYETPRLSPDGRQVTLVVHRRTTPQDPGDYWLGIVPVTGGAIIPLAAEWDRWPQSPHWTPDGSALIVTADEQGHCPVWRVDTASGKPVRLTEDGAYSDVQVSPDGRFAYALRSAVDSPPAPVRVALDRTSQVEPLPGPLEAMGIDLALPGRVEEVTATAEDGTPLRAWLALPDSAGADTPAPLLLWIHGGPLSSWNSWSWRWNPWLAVAQGYAVLLPDPALSTGYGVDFVRRGWGAWGGAPFTDLMTITDATEERPDIDADHTAAMGGSFGGYMANWVAGHTDRFAAIVTHASLWALEPFGTTTDGSYYWRRELTAEMAEANSPHRFADAITTPMLVIHGDKDYRVPIGEALRLWWELVSRSEAEDSSTPHKFLYFPDENHWILTPGHAKLWYDTVFAFLAHNVSGTAWEPPALLG